MLLRRWLVILKETEKLSGALAEGKEKALEQLVASDEANENPRKPSMVCNFLHTILLIS